MADEFNKYLFLEQLRGVAMRPHDFRVLVTLLTYADRDGGNAYPSITTLAADCQMNDKTVAAALQRLKRDGLIRPVRQGGGGRGRTTVWQIASVPTVLRPTDETPRGTRGFSDEETTHRAGGIKPGAKGWLDVENPPSDDQETPHGTPENPPSDDQETPHAVGDNQGMTKVSTKTGTRGSRVRARASAARPPSLPPKFDPDNPEAFEPGERPRPTCDEHPAGTVDSCIPCKIARQSAEYWDEQVTLYYAWRDRQEAAVTQADSSADGAWIDAEIVADEPPRIRNAPSMVDVFGDLFGLGAANPVGARPDPSPKPPARPQDCQRCGGKGGLEYHDELGNLYTGKCPQCRGGRR